MTSSGYKMNELKIGIILSTIRKGRRSQEIGNWLLKESSKYSRSHYEIIDLRDYDLPLYGKEDKLGVSKKFIEKTAEFDGFIFVLAEYNHSIPGVLKNAFDYLGKTMHNKAAAIVSYGAIGGARAAEHLRGILGQMDVACISTQIALSIFYDYDDNQNFKPLDLHDDNLKIIFKRVAEWAKALKPLR